MVNSMSLSVELSKEIDCTVKDNFETMIETNKYSPGMYEDINFIFSVSAHHAFEYTVDNNYMKK